MSVSKGDKITLAQINDLIDKLNSEASRRGVGTISRLSEGSKIQYSTMKNINDLRVTVSTKYRYTGCDPVETCDTVKTTGTPANWDGRDLTKTVLNPGESVLAQYNKAYASQYNLLLSDIEKLNAMCSCNTYRSSKGAYICGPQTNKTYVDKDGWVQCPEQAGTCGGYEAACDSVWVPCGINGTEPCTSNGTEPCTSNGTEPCSNGTKEISMPCTCDYNCSCRTNSSKPGSCGGYQAPCPAVTVACGNHGTQPCNNGTQPCNNGSQSCSKGMEQILNKPCSCDDNCSCRKNTEKECKKMISCPSNCDCEVVACSGYTEWCDDYCTCHHVCTEYTG